MKRFLWMAAAVLVAAGTAFGGPKDLAVTYVKAPLNVPSILEKRLGLFDKAFAPQGGDGDLPGASGGSPADPGHGGGVRAGGPLSGGNLRAAGGGGRGWT